MSTLFTVVLIDYTYEARIQSQVPVDLVLQSLTEEVIEGSLSCDEISENCISFSPIVLIDSFLFGKLIDLYNPFLFDSLC